LILKSGGSVFLGTNPVIILSISEVFWLYYLKVDNLISFKKNNSWLNVSKTGKFKDICKVQMMEIYEIFFILDPHLLIVGLIA
jgi:hypothetical protein